MTIVLSLLLLLVRVSWQQCNSFPIIFGSVNADTNITVIEFNSPTSLIYFGGATFDQKFA